MVARAQRAVDENRRCLWIVVELIDDLQRRVQQVDQMAVFGADDRASADQLDRTIEPFLEERIQVPNRRPLRRGLGLSCVTIRTRE